MIRLPPSCQSFNQFLTYIFNRMDVEDYLAAQQLLREYETGLARTWIQFGSREVPLEVRQANTN